MKVLRNGDYGSHMECIMVVIWSVLAIAVTFSHPAFSNTQLSLQMKLPTGLFLPIRRSLFPTVPHASPLLTVSFPHTLSPPFFHHKYIICIICFSFIPVNITNILILVTYII